MIPHAVRSGMKLTLKQQKSWSHRHLIIQVEQRIKMTEEWLIVSAVDDTTREHVSQWCLY